MAKNNGLIRFKAVEKLLQKNNFFGITAKRNNGRIEYTYISILYHYVTFKVLTARLNTNDIISEKIVLGIKVNGKELKGWNEFIDSVTNAHKIHNKVKYGKLKKLVT